MGYHSVDHTKKSRRSNLNQEALGIDIGGVIIARVRGRSDTSFSSDNYLQTPAVPGVFDAVRQLVAERFGDRVLLVSKCHKPAQDKTMHWLDYHRFYERTGVQREHVYFCRERSEKAEICQEIGITHFVDDRIDVLKNLPVMNGRYWFCPNFKDVRRYAQSLHLVRQINSW